MNVFLGAALQRLALLLFLTLGVFAHAHAQGDTAGQVLARINQARAEAGLAPLARNAQLDAAAQAHVNDLLQNGVGLGHRGSNGSSIRERIAHAGYTSAAVGENWAAYRTLDQIMDFWLHDPPHRRNILESKFRDIGIGVATRPNGGLIVITNFGAPANAPEFAPAAQPTLALTKARATATRAKSVAPKPTRTPTRKPTPKPTRVPKVAPAVTPSPTPEPTQVAIVSQVQDPSKKLLRARGRSARITWQGEGNALVGVLETDGDPLRRVVGAGLMLSGILLLAVAYIGHRNHKAALGLW